MRSLAPLFEPRGAVVIGASRSSMKLGALMTASLGGYEAPIGLVNSRNPGQGIFATVAEAVADVAERGGTADLAVLCVPAAATAAALSECSSAGVRAALVCAGGFGEVGAAGLEYQAAVEESIAASGLRLLGPNTSGFFVPARRLFASFVPGVAELPVGQVSVVASSGGVNHMLSFRLAQSGIGVRLGVGIGAGVDVSHADVLDYLAEDHETTSVALHLETVTDGPALLAAVAKLATVKPVVALVVGRNNVSEFAQSHTGALATSWKTTRALLRQAGAVLVDDEDHLVDAVAALSRTRLVAAPSPGIGLITGQAGPGLLTADSLGTARAHLPRLSDSTQARLGELLPPITFQANPVDAGRPGPGFDQVISTVARDESIDLIGVYGLAEPVVDLLASVMASGSLDEVAVVIGMDGPAADVAAARRAAAEAGVAFAVGPSSLARSLAALVADARGQYLSDGHVPSAPEPFETGGAWDEVRAKGMLDQLGITTPMRRRVQGRQEAQDALLQLGAPVALKIVDASIIHKTEVGGVHLGITTPEELDLAFSALQAIGGREYLIEKMAPSGVDLVLGVRQDPVFGPVVVVGLGGTAAEALGDVAIRSLPLSERSAASMIEDLQSMDLLFSWRGGPSLDVAELTKAIEAVGGALLANPGIVDLEINPLRLTNDGLIALDAVVLTQEDGNAETDK